MMIRFNPQVASRTILEDCAQKAEKRTLNHSSFAESENRQVARLDRDPLVDHGMTG